MAKKENIRIIDIARMAKVSVGTVDRVLHKRGRVSEETRQRVERVLKEIDYKPNMAARLLASQRNFRFAVIIPSYKEGEYWELVSKGVAKAVKELENFNVQVDYLYFDQFNTESFSDVLEQVDKNDYAGVIVATLFKEQVVKLAELLDMQSTPYVFIDANIYDCNNLSYFGSDSSISGAVAAKLMLMKIGNDGDVIIVRTDYKEGESSTQMENREQGFLNYLESENYIGDIKYFDFDTSNQNAGLSVLGSLISYKSKVGAITFNSRIHEVASLVSSLDGHHPKMELIGYDSIERNAQALQDNQVSFIISQRSIQQGYESIRALANYYIFDIAIQKNNYMPIDILIKENVLFYND